MWSGFKAFLLRGNVIELATAVIIGAAFGQIVDGLIKGVIDPLIAMAVPDNNLEKALVVGPFRFGLVLSATVNFLMKAAVVYAFVVRPFTKLAARLAAPAAPAALPPQEVLLTEIRDLLKQQRGAR
jgi:large conductance mechanosensitive channel